MTEEERNQTNLEAGGANGNTAQGSRDTEDAIRRLADLLPAWGVGALDPEEAEYVQAQLLADPDAAQERAEYAALNRALLHSAGGREPSAQLAERLRTALRQEGTPAPQERTLSWMDRLLGESRPMWPRLAVAVAIAALLVLNLAAALRIRALQEQNRYLSAQLSHQQEALALMTASGVQMATLPAAAEGGAAQATVRWTPDGDVAVVHAERFPALEPGMAYQLWLIRDGVRTSGGLFTVDPGGSGTLVVLAPEPIVSYDAMGITPEPAAGSPGPTAPPIVVGPLASG